MEVTEAQSTCFTSEMKLSPCREAVILHTADGFRGTRENGTGGDTVRICPGGTIAPRVLSPSAQCNAQGPAVTDSHQLCAVSGAAHARGAGQTHGQQISPRRSRHV